jgi:hypothetical protein
MKNLVLSICLMSSIVHAAILERFHGTVTVDGAPAEKGMVLIEGNQLKAKTEKSFFVVKFDNGSKAMVRHGNLVLDFMDYKQDKVELISGAMSVFVKPQKKKREFNIKTKTAIMGVRGTKFWLKQDEAKKEAYLCVCEGKVEVTSRKTKKKVMVAKDQDIHVGVDGKLKVKKAGKDMITMAEAGLRDLGEPVKAKK